MSRRRGSIVKLNYVRHHINGGGINAPLLSVHLPSLAILGLASTILEAQGVLQKSMATLFRVMREL